MSRLESLSAQLIIALRQASTERQRSACLVACEYAVRQTGIQSPIVANALKTLRDKSLLPADQKLGLDALAAQLDGEYFNLQEAAEDGRATAEDYLRPFGQARAVAALSFAAETDAFLAASEAIYEAATATEDRDQLITDLLQMLE